MMSKNKTPNIITNKNQNNETLEFCKIWAYLKTSPDLKLLQLCYPVRVAKLRPEANRKLCIAVV